EEAKEPVKPWERPWTTEEMRQQSENWNLAGDAGLLKHLQEFSQNLLARAHTTEVALDSLMEELRATSTSVNNVTNQFLCLANTQFVENRVYDDDEKETPPEEKKEEEKPKSKEEQEAEVVARVRESLALGISVLDTMFDVVEVPASDSEDEESGGRVVLEPHNPYLSRPLPYLIGSREFMEDDTVGLGSLSDSEETGADKNLVQSSDSESEMDVEEKDVPKKRTRLSSTSMSENSDFGASDNSDLGPGPEKQKKFDSSGLFGNIPPSDTGNMFGGDTPTDEDDVINNGATKRSGFAAQLAAKLGAAAESNHSAPKLNNSASKPSMVWEDEDDDDGLFGRRDGKYSGGRGLFDDLEDSPESLWNTKEKSTEKGAAEKQPSLFGPEAENEDNVFSTVARKESKEVNKRLSTAASPGVATSTPNADSGYNQSEKKSGLFNAYKSSTLFEGTDLDDNLFDTSKSASKDTEKVIDEPKQSDVKKKKKPVGGVSMFGSVDVFNAGIRRPPSSSSSSCDDESEQTHEKAILLNPKSISRLAKHNPSKTPSAGKKVSLFDAEDDDNLFDPKFSSSKNPQNQTESGNNEQSVSSSLFHDDISDSLFSKPQKNLSRGSTKPGVSESLTTKQSTSSRKQTSLFNDSDSGDDELLFSSTSSTSSRSRRSQGSGDLLASSGDKVKPPVVQKKGLFDDEDSLFAGLKDDPGFDIFNTETNTTKPNSRNLVNRDLFGPEDKLFKSSTSPLQDKNGSKDRLFGDDDSFDIFNSSNGDKSNKIVDKEKSSDRNVSVKGIESVKPKSGGLFSDDPLDDIFAVPVNTQKEQLSSKVTLTDSLFSGNSVLVNVVDDLFSESLKSKESKSIPKIDEFSDQTDDIFSIPKTVSSVTISTKNELVPKDTVRDSSVLAKNENSTNSIVGETLIKQDDVKSSDLFKAVENESDSDLFNKSTVIPSVSKKPVIASKPDIKQKPKIPTASKSSLIKNSPQESLVFSSVEESTSSNYSNVNTKENTVEEKVLVDNSLSSQNEKTVSVPDQNNVVAKSIEPSSQPMKLEPPKTLNIRKTTGSLFNSSSNEDEGLFISGFPSKNLSDLNSAEVFNEEVKSDSTLSPQDDKPKLFSTEKRSKSEKEISSKLEFAQENVGNSIVKARSVGASPRQLNIDPSALLPGAKPPPRNQHNTEAGVGFDRPAQMNATLHSAGKERARIQTKRRPPSRRARQEAVRNSSIDFGGFEEAAAMSGVSVTSDSLPKETNSLPEPNVHISSDNFQTPELPPTKENISTFLDGSSNSNNNLLSPSTDEEDLFGVPQDLPYESSKDDTQSLFTSAPVLSPLEFKSEALPIFPEETISTKTSENNTRETLDSNGKHTETFPKESANKIPLENENVFPSENIPDDKNDVYDSFRNEPPADDFEDDDEDDDSSDLFSVSKNKITPLQKDNLFETVKDSDSLFSSVKSLPDVDIINIGIPSTSVEIVTSQKESKISQNDPLSLDKSDKNMFENIPKSESSELFSSASIKQDDLFISKKTSSENLHDDLFLPSKSDKNSISYGVEDDLFIPVNKDNKNRSNVKKPNVFDSKQEDGIDDDTLFSSGKQNQLLLAEDDLFSNVKDTNSQKIAAPEKKLNSDLFGGDSPEGDDLFFSTSKKKVGSAVTKGKSGTLVKGSLFDEDEDDDIFGGGTKSHPSNKPANVPVNNEDSLFGSSSTKKKPQMKISNPIASSSSRQAAKEDNDLFEDPLMVITKK
ncbi:hypothetical protein L9F63_013088, partial [Diploptera punctata]